MSQEPPNPNHDPEARARRLLGERGRKAKEHLRQFRPSEYRQLVQERRLHQYLRELELKEVEELNRLQSAGFNQIEALEIVEPLLLFPPSEEEEAAERYLRSESVDAPSDPLARKYLGYDEPSEKSENQET